METLNTFERIETKCAQIESLSLIAQGGQIEELSTENIQHYFAVIISLVNEIQSSLIKIKPIS